jgi:Transposase IS116/IS110/IS902 family
VIFARMSLPVLRGATRAGADKNSFIPGPALSGTVRKPEGFLHLVARPGSSGSSCRVLQVIMGWEDSHLHSFTDHNPFVSVRRPANTRSWAPVYVRAEDDDGWYLPRVSRWREREEELALSIARAEAVRLAKHILDLEGQLKTNEKQLDELVKVSEAAPLLEEKGFQAVTAAKCLVAWSHEGRVHSEAAFACLAGVNPIPASSGNTVRHRLNRGGDRRLNSALHMAAITRMTYDSETCEYVEKRRAEGKTDKEIRRCVKRYLARRVFRILNAAALAKKVQEAA